ncbi:MAG: hypothetical protein SO179_03180 [Bacteroidales bacterium]|nr:hypothetical protein [Bacteroidales bacterium]
MKSILVDTGFWFALYNKKDQHYNEAQELIGYLSRYEIIIPYPTLYETVNTRFSKNTKQLEEFRSLLRGNNFKFIDDTRYIEGLLDQTFDSALNLKPYSLVDMVIRRILDDNTIRISSMITFNKGDFIDVCQRRNIAFI